MVHQYLRNPSSTSWNDVGIALCNGGGIRNPIDPTRPPGLEHIFLNILDNTTHIFDKLTKFPDIIN